MIRMILVFATLTLWVASCSNCMGQDTWIKTFGGRKDEIGNSITIAPDGGVLMTGMITSFDGDFKGLNKNVADSTGDICVVKLDQGGQTVWKKVFGGTSHDVGCSITTTSEDCILVAGWTRSNDADFAGLNHGSGDIFIIKLDKNGDLIWKKLFGGTSSEEAYSVTTSSDASILITGRTYSNSGTFKDMAKGSDDGFVVKLDKNGEILWTSVLGGTLRDWFYSIAVTSDDNVVVSGWTTSKDGDLTGLNKGESDIFVAKLDKDGRVVWKNSIGGTRSDVSSSVTTTSDGGILIAGSTESNDGDFKELNKGSADITVIKLDMYGEVIWKKLLGGTRQEGNTSITTTSDNDVLITGFTNSKDEDFKGKNSYNGEVFIIKLDGNGKVKYTKWCGGTFGDEGSSISSTPNGNILVTGWFNSNDGIFTDMNRGEKDIFIMQLDSNGNLNKSNSVNEQTTTSKLSVSPNPLSTSSTITYTIDTPSLVRIELMNTLGQVVDVVFDGYGESGTQHIPLDVSSLTSGMYCVRMTSGAGISTAQACVVR